MKLSNKLINHFEFNLIIVKQHGNGDGNDDEDEECVNPIIVLVTEG